MRLPKDVREPVESFAADMAFTKPAAERGERDPVLGIHGIDRSINPDDVQEPGECFGHRS